MGKVKNKIIKVSALTGIAVILASADGIIKSLVDKDVIKNGNIDKNGVAEIEKHHNKGLALNRLETHTKEITDISKAMLAVQAINTALHAVKEDDPIGDAANAIILAGAMSNTYDRISKGYVTDYLKVGKKTVIYNISDFFILGGTAITIMNFIIREMYLQFDT